MLPLFTTGQVKDGIDTGDLMLDLSEYMKKKDAATKTELETLTAVVAGKLDATPQHNHFISDVKDLTETLEGKYDTSKKYSYNVILSDSEKIPFLEKPRVEILEVSKNKSEWGYRFYVDDASGDLMILSPTDLLIATYSIAAGKWSFETDTTEIETSIDNLDKRVDDHDTVLENHGEALNAVCNATLRNITDISACNSAIAENSESIKNHTHSEVSGYKVGTQSSNNYKKSQYIPTVFTDGVMEVGKYIDLHEYTDANQANHDYSIRIYCEGNTLKCLGSNYTSANLNIGGTLTVNNTDILAKINNMDAILKNHYDALLLLCQKHGMVDSNTTDGNNITPQ